MASPESLPRQSSFEAALATASRALAGFICHHAPPCNCTTEILRRAVGDAAEKRSLAGSNQPGQARAQSAGEGVVISFPEGTPRHEVERMKGVIRNG